MEGLSIMYCYCIICIKYMLDANTSSSFAYCFSIFINTYGFRYKAYELDYRLSKANGRFLYIFQFYFVIE